MKIQGYLYAALAAATYGTNPIFAKPLYAAGMNPDSVLLFRYCIAIVMMAVLMGWNAFRKKKPLKELFVVQRHSMPQLILMGLLMSASSILLFVSCGTGNPRAWRDADVARSHRHDSHFRVGIVGRKEKRIVYKDLQNKTAAKIQRNYKTI